MRATMHVLCLAVLFGLFGQALSQPKLEIFTPLIGEEFPKDQEIVMSMQGTDFPKNDKLAVLTLNKKKLRDLPLPADAGEVFNVSLTGMKKGKYEVDVSGETRNVFFRLESLA